MSDYATISICITTFALSLVIALWASPHIGMGLFYGILWSPIALIALLILRGLSLHLLQYLKEKYPTKRRIRRDHMDALSMLKWLKTEELLDIYTQFRAMEGWRRESFWQGLDEFYPHGFNDDEEPERYALIGAVFLGLGNGVDAGPPYRKQLSALKRIQIVLSKHKNRPISASFIGSILSDIVAFVGGMLLLGGPILLLLADLKHANVEEHIPATLAYIVHSINTHWLVYWPLRFIMSIAFIWLVRLCVESVVRIAITWEES